MKQSLQLKLGQQLTMTPQLQQAIRLLQLSTLDLQAEIQEALDSNPMLEVTDEDVGDRNSDASDTPEESHTNGADTKEIEHDFSEINEPVSQPKETEEPRARSEEHTSELQ